MSQEQIRSDDKFIPATIEREIAPNIVFRPIRSWHSATYAGEGLYKIPNTEDGSGCLKLGSNAVYDKMCSPPSTVTHRLYWNKDNPKKNISAFLSYPNAMGCSDEYFWETYGMSEDGYTERFFGENAEAEMEAAIIKALQSKERKRQ